MPTTCTLSIGELLRDLDVSDEATPAEESPASPVPVPINVQVVVISPARTEDTLSLPPRSPFEAGMIENLLVPSPVETLLSTIIICVNLNTLSLQHRAEAHNPVGGKRVVSIWQNS